MVTTKIFHIIIVHVIFSTEYVSSTDWKRVCYFNATARHRDASIKFDTINIDFNLCTHYVYAYAGIDLATNSLFPVEPDNELDDTGAYITFTGKNLATRRKAKTLLSIGGRETSTQSALVELTKLERRTSTFSKNAVDFLRSFGFDGLDIDFQYQTTAAMKSVLVLLLKALRSAFDQDKAGEKLILTVKCTGVYSSDVYDVPSISRYVDYVVIAAYNLPTPDPNKAWFGSPLYSMPITVNSTVREWLQKGLPAKKTVVGITGVGRYLTLANKAIYKPGSAIIHTDLTGPLYKLPNALAYPEICAVFNTDRYFDKATQMHYMRVTNKWVGYEDTDSIRAKISWMKSLNLAGVMFAEIDMDDFNGSCRRGVFPLMQTVKQVSDKVNTMKPIPATTRTTKTTIKITIPIKTARTASRTTARTAERTTRSPGTPTTTAGVITATLIEDPRNANSLDAENNALNDPQPSTKKRSVSYFFLGLTATASLMSVILVIILVVSTPRRGNRHGTPVQDAELR